MQSIDSRFQGPAVADFERDSLTNNEQEHHLSALLQCQLNLARSVSTDSPFASNLQKVRRRYANNIFVCRLSLIIQIVTQ